MDSLAAIPDVCEVMHLRGSAAAPDAVPDLLIEVPHGATRAVHFTKLRAELRGEYPADLQDFFFVNTDVGAPEVAVAVAQHYVAALPRRSAVVVRCLIPRTFVDCNRVIDADVEPKASAAGEMTPGLQAYVRDLGDRRLLLERYGAYRELVTRAYEKVCGGGGFGVMLHSYAPRSIDVPVDERIVERLRREYEVGRIGSWPLRAEVDFIAKDEAGRVLGSQRLLDGVGEEVRRAGYGVAVGATYALHPVTMAYQFAVRYPGKTLCLEVRRDLLVGEFRAFEEMCGEVGRVGRIGGAVGRGVVGVVGGE